MDLGSVSSRCDSSGVTMRIMSRFTKPSACLGSSICSGNGDFQSLLQQAFHIPFSTVVRNPAHGYRIILVFLARCQRDVEGFGGDDGIIVKQLVKSPMRKKSSASPALAFKFAYCSIRA